jgi:hypothetical protein
MTFSDRPRALYVLRRARRSLVSTDQNCFASSLLGRYIRHRSASAPIHLVLNAADPTYRNQLYHSLNTINPIQSA